MAYCYVMHVMSAPLTDELSDAMRRTSGKPNFLSFLEFPRRHFF